MMELFASKSETQNDENESPLEKHLGFGYYQKRLLFTFFTLSSFIGGINVLQLIFLVTKKRFRCSLPDPFESRFHNESQLGIDGCSAPEILQTDYCLSNATNQSQFFNSCLLNNSSSTCANGYIHESFSSTSEPSNFFWSLVAENDWVCDRISFGPNLFMAQGIGYVLNNFVFGHVSDTWGRLPIFHIVNLTFIVARLIVLVTYNNDYALLFLFCVGSGYFPVGVRLCYVLMAEFTNERGRRFVYILGWTTWVAGLCCMSLIAYLTQHWYWFLLWTTLPNVLLIPFYWVCPESPRLLLAQGKKREAMEIIEKVKKCNGTWNDDNDNIISDLELEAQRMAEAESIGIRGVLKSKKLATILALLCVTCYCNDVFAFGGSLNVENLAGNPFLNFALVSLTDLPACLIGIFLINKLGRRWSHVFAFGLASISYLIITCMSHSIDIDPLKKERLGLVISFIAMVAKIASNTSWFINWVQLMELTPTSARNTGMMAATTFSMSINLATPYIILLGRFNLTAMYLIFVLIGSVGAVTASFLPESHKIDFPETVEDIEKRRWNDYFTWRVWLKKAPGVNAYEIK